jgi:hypothetical protein
MKLQSTTKTNTFPVTIFLFIVLISCFIFFTYFYMVSPLPEDIPALIIENTVLLDETPFIIEHDHALLSYNIIKEHLDPYIFWDAAEDNYNDNYI